jgi:hypothetical protein
LKNPENKITGKMIVANTIDIDLALFIILPRNRPSEFPAKLIKNNAK